MSFRSSKKIKTAKKRKTTAPRTRKQKTAVAPKTSTTKKQPSTTAKAVPIKNIKSEANANTTNENTLLRNNFNKVNADLIKVKKSNEDLVRQNNSLLAQITKLERLQKTTKERDIPKQTREITTLNSASPVNKMCVCVCACVSECHANEIVFIFSPGFQISHGFTNDLFSF